ncbi:MAG: hypothetical protein ACNA8W_01450 [Bradymonadaceae bacterium]
MTERVIRAMDNPYFNILAHPAGRLINRRPPHEMDMERVMLAHMGFGVCQARRGWLEPDDILNTRRVADLLRLLARG